MEGRLLLKNCSLFRADGRVRSGLSVLIEGRLITAVKPDGELPVLPGDWEVRCDGRLVTTGLVDCHTRLVGGPLTPISGGFLLRAFVERFEVEQRAEAHLTPGEVEAITAFSIGQNLRRGVAMAVEHLHAPACVEEAMHAQAQVADALGLRLLHAHASSSTVAQVPGPAQVEANARYIESRPRDSLARGAIGVRASFCADDDLLRVAGQAKERLTVGAHLGLAENDDDLALTWSNTNSRIVTRFERFGLLGGASVGAFARVINRSEAMRLAQSRTLIALTPGVSQASHGGTAPGLDTMTHQNLIGLGTAGTGTLWEELTASFTSIMAMARAGRMLDPDALIASFLVSGPAELCTMVYGAPSGSVDVGALADLVVYDFVPSEENQNCPAHFLLRLSMMPVAWNIVDGRVRVREGRLVGADEAALALESARALQSVWKRAGVG